MYIIRGDEFEGSVHPPSGFIRQHWQRLLPHWPVPVLSVLVILQRSPVALDRYSAEAERSKQTLRDRVISLATPILNRVSCSQYRIALFDPPTGLPYQTSDPGIPLNDIAVIRDTLGYPFRQCGQCFCVIHPTWNSCVYPTIIVSSAPPATLWVLAKPDLNSPHSPLNGAFSTTSDIQVPPPQMPHRHEF